MKNNLGYACINMTLSEQPKSKRITTNRSMIKRTFKARTRKSAPTSLSQASATQLTLNRTIGLVSISSEMNAIQSRVTIDSETDSSMLTTGNLKKPITTATSTTAKTGIAKTGIAKISTAKAGIATTPTAKSASKRVLKPTAMAMAAMTTKTPGKDGSPTDNPADAPNSTKTWRPWARFGR